MDINDSMRRLDVTLYGNVETLTPTLSKCRVRIFYRGLNRNRTYIDDSFAQQLIDSLPYAPVKGIFDKNDLDFKDHGEDNTDGRIYGIIAADPNFAWEQHEDEDGIVREYACADVILYTALYPEANLISGKSQSMEIHKLGLTGEWKIWAGDKQPYYHFYKGHLLGLQVLGDEVEPCFEGSAFFSLYKDAKDLYDYLKNSKVKEESKKMDKNLFKLSDSAKCDLLWDALNTEADSYTIVCDIYDEYAIGYDVINRKYIRAYYTKDDNADSVTINNVEDCYIVDINSAEKAALDALKSLGSYSDIQSKVENSDAEIARITAEYESSAAALQEKIDALTAELESYKKAEEEPKDDVQTNNAKNDDDDDDKKKKNDDDDKKGDKNSLEDAATDNTAELVSSYEAKLAEKDAEIARLNQVNSDITNEKSELENFKKSVDNEKKTEILNKFSAHLTETQITDYTSKMENYSVEDFEKEVCFAAYQSDASVLTKDASKDSDLIWDNSGKSFETGALALLRKHTGR